MHRRSSFPFLFLLAFVFLLRGLCAASPIQERADRFLKLTNAGYQALFRVNSEAQWLAVTDVTPEHDAVVEATGKAYAAFNGNPAIITEARDLLTREGINAAERSAVETTASECGGRADDKSGPGRKTRGGRNQAGLNSE
jgi:hypothetical protein